jgi:Mce-associated membrane protein
MTGDKSEPENTVTEAPTKAEYTSVPDEPTAKAGFGRTLPLVLGALCVVMAVVVGILIILTVSGPSSAKADAAAVEAARTKAPLVLSYAPATVDQDIATARQQLSGTFAQQFDQLVNQVVLPATKQQGLSSKTDVTHVALMESQPQQSDARDVLIFMHQTVSATGQPPQEGVIQVKVTVTKNAEGQWLVSNLQPI